MNWSLELVTVPVSDVDRAKAFYVDGMGFTVDGNGWSIQQPPSVRP